MTPEEIIAFYETSKAHATDNEDIETSKLQAIEAIKAYARQMCDKQKEIILSDKTGRILMKTTVMNISRIQIVPYPKEL
jgi:hypothetical protein